MDLDRVSCLLRRLAPEQEKIIRLYFGLGCQRSHSVQEMAEEFAVSVEVIAGILKTAQRKLAQDGLTTSELRRALQEIEIAQSTIPPSLPKANTFKRGCHPRKGGEAE